jgi:hypothetical protein
MSESLTVCSWVEVRNGSPITCEVHGSGVATVEFGGHGEGLEMQFDSEALRRLVALGTEALRDMDERYAREQAKARIGLAATSLDQA